MLQSIFPRPLRRLAALMILCAAAACGTSESSTAAATVADSAGVTIVRSDARDVIAPLESEAVVSLGGKDTPEESFYRVTPGLVETNDDGDIYVLDRDAYQVQIFDSTGTHLRSLGHQGSGPGELQFPVWLVVDGDEGVWVADLGKRALVRWGPDGELLEPGPLPEAYRGGGVGLVASGFVVELGGLQSNRLAILGDSGEPDVLAEIPRGEGRDLDLESCGVRIRAMEPVFSPRLVWDASGNVIVVAGTADYVLDVYVDGRLVRSVRRDSSPRAASEALAEASFGDGLRINTPRGERVCDPAEVVEQQGFAPYLPAVGQVAIAPDGGLWVERYDVGDGPHTIDVFDSAGGYVATLPEGARFPVGFLPDGRILVSERDELDVERLVVRTVEMGS